MTQSRDPFEFSYGNTVCKIINVSFTSCLRGHVLILVPISGPLIGQMILSTIRRVFALLSDGTYSIGHDPYCVYVTKRPGICSHRSSRYFELDGYMCGIIPALLEALLVGKCCIWKLMR